MHSLLYAEDNPQSSECLHVHLVAQKRSNKSWPLTSYKAGLAAQPTPPPPPPPPLHPILIAMHQYAPRGHMKLLGCGGWQANGLHANEKRPTHAQHGSPAAVPPEKKEHEAASPPEPWAALSMVCAIPIVCCHPGTSKVIAEDGECMLRCLPSYRSMNHRCCAGREKGA